MAKDKDAVNPFARQASDVQASAPASPKADGLADLNVAANPAAQEGLEGAEASSDQIGDAEGAEKALTEPHAVPAWNDFTQFICKHGDVIIQARYPNPPRDLIDTIWRGVPIFDAETVEYRYEKNGWTDHGSV